MIDLLSIVVCFFYIVRKYQTNVNRQFKSVHQVSYLKCQKMKTHYTINDQTKNTHLGYMCGN